MTKKEWEDIRDKEEIPFSLYYQYYLENKGGIATLSLEDFTHAFQIYLFQGEGQMIRTSKGIKFINYLGMIDKVYKYFNKKFV